MNTTIVIDDASPRLPTALRRSMVGPASPDVRLSASWARWSLRMAVACLLSARHWERRWPVWREGLRTSVRLTHAVDVAVVRAVVAVLRWRPPVLRLPASVLVALLVAVATLAIPVGAMASVTVIEAIAARNTDPVRLPPLPTPATVLRPDGRVLGAFANADFQRPVELDDIAPVLVRAVVDTEDARYWEHQGLDAKGLARAAVVNLRARRIKQGGSTIAQQLAKITYLTPERSMDRKLSEMVLAQRLHRQLGRRPLLERYLNSIYLGHRAYGVEAAARRYFGVPASQVTAGQAAMLAGLIHDPRGDDPITAPEAARARRQHVIGLMVEKGHLTEAEAAAAAAEPLPTTLAAPEPRQGWVLDAVRAELLADERLGATRAARERLLHTGGLRITTTVDERLQASAAAAMAGTVPRHLDASYVAVDPRNGEIRAVVGGIDYQRSQYDVATSAPGRQPGSGAKLFTLVTALENGMTATSPILGSAPCPIPNPGGTPNPWKPGNYEGGTFGRMTLADATSHSVNCAFARMIGHFGPAKVAATARRLGITTPLPEVPSLALGSVPLKPVELAAAYAALANRGIWFEPHVVSEVRSPSGKVLIGGQPAGRRVMSEKVADTALDIFRGVVRKGTGRAAAIPGWDIAGKTGTTNNSQDAWFTGVTRTLSASVWLGHREGEIPMARIGGRQVTGGGIPARVWRHAVASQPAPPPMAAAPPRPVATAAPKAGGWCWSSCGRPGLPPAGWRGAAPSPTAADTETTATTAKPGKGRRKH